MNVLALSQTSNFWHSLVEDITRNESSWETWYESSTPETAQVPDYEQKFGMNPTLSSWYKLQLMRAVRKDRLIVCAKEFVRATEQMGPRYIEPVSDTLKSIFEEMTWQTPVIYLLSVGADPTDAIQYFCHRKKRTMQTVSMGQGQEPVALRGIDDAIHNGSWLLLQNCELGLGLMSTMEQRLKHKYSLTYNTDEHLNFRLFLTANPHPEFPLGLLQMSLKTANEPPAGLRAGLMRSYNTIVDQDRIDRVDSGEWRQMLFSLSFLHSIVQERRKFGGAWILHSL